jgi:hypothetical protein
LDDLVVFSWWSSHCGATTGCTSHSSSRLVHEHSPEILFPETRTQAAQHGQQTTLAMWTAEEAGVLSERGLRSVRGVAGQA